MGANPDCALVAIQSIEGGVGALVEGGMVAQVDIVGSSSRLGGCFLGPGGATPDAGQCCSLLGGCPRLEALPVHIVAAGLAEDDGILHGRNKQGAVSLISRLMPGQGCYAANADLVHVGKLRLLLCHVQLLSIRACDMALCIDVMLCRAFCMQPLGCHCNAVKLILICQGRSGQCRLRVMQCSCAGRMHV